jgi:hypothetical protein
MMLSIARQLLTSKRTGSRGWWDERTTTERAALGVEEMDLTDADFMETAILMEFR